jgi:hypothetical protein
MPATLERVMNTLEIKQNAVNSTFEKKIIAASHLDEQTINRYRVKQTHSHIHYLFCHIGNYSYFCTRF